MSSPSHRRQRSSQSATPRRNGRQSEANTPREPSSQPGLASSPIFFQSSSPGLGDRENGTNREVSSPLRQMTDSQSTGNGGPIPSSPLQQMSDTQSIMDDQATPRANRNILMGGTLVLFGIF